MDTDKGQPVFSEEDREQLRLDRASGFSEGQIAAGREAQAMRPIDRETAPPRGEQPAGPRLPDRAGQVPQTAQEPQAGQDPQGGR